MLSVDINLLFTIINLIVLFLIMNKFLYKPVMGIIEKRQELIDNQFKEAKEAEDKAMAMKAEYEENLATVEDKKAKIIADANERGQNEYNRIVTEAHDEAGRIIDTANKKIEAEKDKTLRDIKDQVASMAMIAAAKIVNDGSGNIDNGAIYDSFLNGKGQGEE